MFTGIIEAVGRVHSISAEQNNLRLGIEASFAHQLKIDQSVAHNGVCLTVVDVQQPLYYEVVAVQETLQRTNLGKLKKGDPVNLERCLLADARLDGHFVQGHIDCTATVVKIEELSGSWKFVFSYPTHFAQLIVEKGSICVNGVSLTVVDVGMDTFSVVIIPYTYGFTNFRFLKLNDEVNIEYDVLGKYVQRMLSLRK